MILLFDDNAQVTMNRLRLTDDIDYSIIAFFRFQHVFYCSSLCFNYSCNSVRMSYWNKRLLTNLLIHVMSPVHSQFHTARGSATWYVLRRWQTGSRAGKTRYCHRWPEWTVRPGRSTREMLGHQLPSPPRNRSALSAHDTTVKLSFRHCCSI